MWEVISSLINLLLGGGLLATLATLKATRRKADAESQEKYMELSKLYVDEFQANIAAPLREAVNESKKETASLKRETARLRKVIEKSKACIYSDDCPVRHELHKLEDCEQGEQGGSACET